MGDNEADKREIEGQTEKPKKPAENPPITTAFDVAALVVVLDIFTQVLILTLFKKPKQASRH